MLATTIPVLSVPPPFSVSPIVPVPTPSDNKPPIVLQDDPPHPLRVKAGPLGQIMRASSSAAKKKAKAKDSGIPMGYVAVAVPMTEPTMSGGLNPSETQTIKIGPAVGVAAGTGGAKQKGKAADGLPPVIVASA